MHFPIVDLAIPDAQALEPFVQELIARVAKGESRKGDLKWEQALLHVALQGV